MRAAKKHSFSRYARAARTALRRYTTFVRLWLKRRTGNLIWEPYLQQLGANRVIVQWATRKGGTPVVHLWKDAAHNHDVKTTRGSSWKVAALGIHVHRVELNGLTPNAQHRYSIDLLTGKRSQPAQDGGDGSASRLPQQWISFFTAPPTGSDTPFAFLAFGDYGNGTESQLKLRDQMAHELQQDGPSARCARFILTLGDNSQGSGTYQELDMHVFAIYREIFSRLAVYPALGNHCYLTDAAAPYLDLFDLPMNAAGHHEMERYYSFDFGNVHFSVLDTNNPLDEAIEGSKDEGMLAWFKKDLQTTQRWKIVVCHHPPYNAGDRGCDLRVREHIVPLLEANGVDLVLSGHQHNYQRSKPLRGDQVTTVQQGGIVYIISGAGARAQHACQESEWLDLAICSASHGLYSRITVSRNNLNIEAVDDSGRIRDKYILQKDK